MADEAYHDVRALQFALHTQHVHRLGKLNAELGLIEGKRVWPNREVCLPHWANDLAALGRLCAEARACFAPPERGFCTVASGVFQLQCCGWCRWVGG